MTIRSGFEPITINRFGGLVEAYGSVPLQSGGGGTVATTATNVVFTPLSVETRPGIENLLSLGSTTDVTNMFHVSSNNGSYVPLLSSNAGTELRIFKMDAAYTTLTQMSSLDSQAVPRFAEDSGRGYASIAKAGKPWQYPQKLDPNAQTAPGGTTLSSKSLSVGTGPASLRHGTAAVAAGGSCTDGTHYIVAIMETYDGRRGPVMTFPLNATCAAGNNTIQITGLSVYGSYDVWKVLFFMTPANVAFAPAQFPLGGYYCVETTTSGMVWRGGAINISVSDTELLSGTPIEEVLDTWPLGPCAGTTIYNSRQVAWGLLNEMIPRGLDAMQYSPVPQRGTFNLPNLRFWSQVSTTQPCEWNPAAGAPGAGGLMVLSTDIGGGMYWRMTGDGASAVRGRIRTDSATISTILGDLYYALEPNRSYTVRLSARYNPAGTVPGAGRLRCYAVNGPTGLATNLTSLSSFWNVYEAELTASSTNLTVGSPLSLEIDNTPVNGVQVEVKDICIYPTDTPILENVLAVSNAGDVETFHQLTGFVGIPTDTEGGVTACFTLRGSLYICKKTALYAASDNGDEPNTWPVSKVSDTVGVDSPNAIGYGDGYVVLFGRNGAYYFDGATPTKVSEEISAFNNEPWDVYGYATWCTVDSERQMAWFGFHPAQIVLDQVRPSITYMVDFHQGWQSDPLENIGFGRKWSVWRFSGLSSTRGSYFMVKKPSDGKMLFSLKYTNSNLVQWPSTTNAGVSNYYDYSATGANSADTIQVDYKMGPIPSSTWGRHTAGYAIFRYTGDSSAQNNLSNRYLLYAPGGSISTTAKFFPTNTTGVPIDIRVYHNFTQDYFVPRFLSSPDVSGTTNADNYFKLYDYTLFLEKQPGQNWLGG